MAYIVLKERGVIILPLPTLWQQNKNPYQNRIEPDFFILLMGKPVIIEIDGDSHKETPCEADERLLPLRKAGVIIKRLSADEFREIETARIAVDMAISELEEEISNRR